MQLNKIIIKKITFDQNIWIFSSLIFVISASSEFFFFDKRQVAFFSTLTDDAIFSCMMGRDVLNRYF